MLKFSQALNKAQTVRAFVQDRSGDVAALFGLMAIVLFLTIGGAVDYGRWLHARNQTLSAMDSAVLAAGRALQVGGDTNEAVAAGQAFYAQNVLTRLPVTSDTIDFTVGEDGMSVTASGNATIATPFLSIINIEQLDILDSAGADYSQSEVAVGGNAGINLEISMMLDVTGSMSGSRISDLKVAAKDLIDIVVWEDQSEFTSRVALVPFSEGIRLPPSAMSAARGSPESIYDYRYWRNGRMRTRRYYRTECVGERLGLQRYSDAAPGSGNYVTTVYTTSSSRNCEPNSSAVIQPLSNNAESLKTKIDALTTDGGTAGQLGTAWSWYTLSPNWNSLWSDSANHAVAYGTPDTQKIAILMTDGSYNTQYRQRHSNNNRVVGYKSNSGTNGSSTMQARSLCTAMKLAGVTVYTVGFGLSANSTPATTMALCATDPSKAFSADDGEELRQAFRAIALELSKLRLAS